MSEVAIEVTALKLRNAILRWQDNRGEYAEILKAEAQAKVEGIENSYEATITAQRHDGEKAALQYTKESLEYKARVEIDEHWINYYTLLITHNILIDVSDCP